MEHKFVKPDIRVKTIFNLSLVYKIEKNGIEITFYYLNGESFTINSGQVSDEIKELLDGSSHGF